MKNNSPISDSVLRNLLGLPISGKQVNLHKRVVSLLNDLNFSNVQLEDGSLYNGHAEFCIMINHAQDIVESGYPLQTIIYCDLDSNSIEVSQMTSTYDETKNLDDCLETVAQLDFTWQTLENLIVENHDKIIP